jgi:cytidine deaminase
MRNITYVQWQALEEAARAACARACCPYSRFPVGAAVLSADGSIAGGCNVENASFGLASCAERNAIFRAVADGATSIVALVLYAPTKEPVAPCGACRQVLAEFGRDAQVHCICDGPGSIDCVAHELLPHGFTLAKRAQAP